MEKSIIVKFVEERNSLLFQAAIQGIIEELDTDYNIEVQYFPQYYMKTEQNISECKWYTALIIARRK